jgi:hypothetical protein
MEIIAQGLGRFGLFLVIACIGGSLIFLLSGLFTLRDLGRASFRLERSTVVGRAISAFLRSALCLLVGGLIYYMTGVLDRPAASAPQVGQLRFAATPTPRTIVLTLIPTADIKQAEQVAAVVAQATPISGALSLPTPSLDNALLVTVTATPLLTPTALPTLAVLDVATVTPPPPALAVPTNTPPPRANSDASVPTLAVIPISSNSGPTPAPVSVVQSLPTPTLAPSAVPAAPAAAAPPADASNCATADLRLYKPASGESIGGAYRIVGDAVFGTGKYKIEVLPNGDSAWRFIWEGFEKVQGDTMMAPGFQTTIFPNGAYLMRLTLVTPSGQEVARCVVPFTIAN